MAWHFLRLRTRADREASGAGGSRGGYSAQGERPRRSEGTVWQQPLGRITRRDRCGGGRVLQVSSEGGQIAYPNFSLYHTTKWGIEGFVEAVAQEVAPFNIEFTIVEPGPAKTSFGGGLVSPPPMDVYENTPAGDVRRAIAAGGFPLPGDPVKMARAMIDSADRSPAPRRLTLGSDAYAKVRAALVGR